MCNNKTIWEELCKSNYQLESIEITIETKFLELNINFANSNDLDNFTNNIFNKYYQLLNNVELSNNLLLVNLFDTSNIVDLFETLNYPSNVKIIKIIVKNEIVNSIKSQNNSIKLLNLPDNLSQLKIISIYPFDLSNLPIQIVLLDIVDSDCKFNLNYLPDSIQILYLPQINTLKLKDYNYFYKLSDLSNLPSSLVEINFGTNTDIVYKSTSELMEKFNNNF